VPGGGDRRWDRGGARDDDACESVSGTFRLVLLELFLAVEMAGVDVEEATEAEVEAGVASTGKLLMQTRASIHCAWGRTLELSSIAAERACTICLTEEARRCRVVVV
jgi:hypothetical protein